MLPNPVALHARRLQIDEIGHRFGVSHIRVYGSVARGTPHAGSDVDLLVAIERGRSLLDLIGFEEEVTELLGVPVDVVTEEGLHPRLREAVLSEALTL